MVGNTSWCKSRRSEFAGLVGGITFTGGGMMMNRTQGVFLMVLLIQFAMVTTGLAQSTSPGWEPIEEERLLNPEDGDWMNYRRTYDVTGFSPLSQINRENVDELRLVWAHSMGDGSRWVPTPVVSNGLMFVAESDRVTAFEVETGDVAWVHQRSFPDDIQKSQALGRSRGVSVYRDRVYWATADTSLVVLDQQTGEQQWEVSTGDYSDGLGHAHPALIADGKVVLGFAGGDKSARGLVVAHDVETGEHLWTTYTVPEPGDAEYETWGEREVPPMGGLTWGTISYDPELGFIYLGTGQPTPWASTLRGPGDALYTNTILALDIDTGEIEWHFQVVPADNWDLDATHESMLVDLEIGGRSHKALIETSKIGWGIVLDRETGRFLRAFRTGYDNIVTGWTDSGSPIINPALIPTMDDVDSDKVFEVCPHYHGTRNLNAPSYSPDTGLYYLGINNSCMDVTFVSEEFEPGRIFRGIGSRTKQVPGYDYIGEFVAFDPVSGRRAWEFRYPGGVAMTASALATGGGVVFGGTADRRLFALDADSGDRLWETRLNGDISGAPVTFEVNGRQYVAVGAGGRIGMTTSYARFTNTTIPQGSGVMWVFALPE
jgi:alcohol dehydrogenase (cytochrome c)